MKIDRDNKFSLKKSPWALGNFKANLLFKSDVVDTL